MSLFLKITFSLISLCLFAVFVFAQKSEQKKVSSQPAKGKNQAILSRENKDEGKIKIELAERHQQALWTLRAIESEAKKLDGTIMKVKIMSEAANTLWEYDKPRARRLFTEAFDTIGSVKLDPNKDQRIRMATTMGARGPLGDLRSDILQIITQRDPKLAEKLRNTIEESQKDNNEGRQNKPSEKETLAWEMAVALAKTQPEQTTSFVHAHLQNGVNEMLGDALISIRRENPQLADQLFGDALKIARVQNTSLDALAVLAEYVLPTEQEAFYGRNPAANETRKTVISNFLGYVVERLARQAALGNPITDQARETQNEYKMLQALLPSFEILMPDKSIAVRDRMMALRIALASQQSEATQSSRQEPTVDDLVREAENTTEGRKRDIRFVRASMAALHQGDLERAISIVEKMGDTEERSIQLSLVLYQVSLKTLDKGEIEEAHRLAQRIEFLPQRVIVFIRIVDKLRASKKLDQARDTLEEIWRWTNKANDSPQKAKALLTLTATMTKQDVQRGFEFLQSTVRTIDQTDFTLPETKGKQTRVLQITLDMLDFRESFLPLARIDFERSSQIAQSFANKEASLFAQLIVCQQGLLPSKEGQ
jgi:hypothetical protein